MRLTAAGAPGRIRPAWSGLSRPGGRWGRPARSGCHGPAAAARPPRPSQPGRRAKARKAGGRRAQSESVQVTTAGLLGPVPRLGRGPCHRPAPGLHSHISEAPAAGAEVSWPGPSDDEAEVAPPHHLAQSPTGLRTVRSYPAGRATCKPWTGMCAFGAGVVLSLHLNPAHVSPRLRVSPSPRLGSCLALLLQHRRSSGAGVVLSLRLPSRSGLPCSFRPSLARCSRHPCPTPLRLRVSRCLPSRDADALLG